MTNNNASLTGTEYKAMQGQVNIDEAQGIIECFVAGLGNKDSVGDICLPGCFTESLKRRKPRVVWGHNWNEPIGKVIEIYEVGPNDPRLPMKMKRAGIGGLYAKVQFNLKSERGRQAFADVAFFGEDQEWSIGYKTLNADYDSQRQANLLREVELYEVSPVLHGANQLTSTISIKSDEQLRDPEGGLTAAGRRHFNETEGSNLKPGVDGPADTPDKLRRKGSFLTRFFTNPSGPMKDEKGEPTRLALSASAWGESIPQNMEDAAALAAKGRRLLEKYASQKEKTEDGIYKADDSDDDYQGPRGEDGGIPVQNPSMGRAGNLVRALAMRFGGSVRLRNADQNLAVFDHMSPKGEKHTYRVTYHFDGDEFMFGSPVRVRPETVYLPENNGIAHGEDGREDNPFEDQYEETIENNPSAPQGIKPKMCGCEACSSQKNTEPEDEPLVKAPTPEAGIPQERFTGDVLQGRGPRRGNLEQLLKYWRPIMRREGGFRRCKVILADHPELYPLNNICAWLHHETTGLWPNEGCHHPGMKNCRNKIRGVSNGSIWNDREWNDRLNRLPSAEGAGKGLDMMEDDLSPADIEGKAAEMLKSFLAEQPEFVKFIEDSNNWEHAGDDDNDTPVVHVRPMSVENDKDDCGCGCGGAGKPNPVRGIMAALAQLGKSVEEDVETKAGRIISNRNMKKLQEAMQILQEVVASSDVPKEPTVQVKSNGEMRISASIDSILDVKSFINPILEYHQIDSEISETGIYFNSSISSEAKSAVLNALQVFKDVYKEENR